MNDYQPVCGWGWGSSRVFRDCHGDLDGQPFTDQCGSCVGGNTGLTACYQDCNGIWGGPHAMDNCGVCDTDTTNDNSTCVQDCAGMVRRVSTNVESAMRTPPTITTPARPCLGVWGGTAVLDNCGICDTDNSNNNSTCTEDCEGAWGGTAFIDPCGGYVDGTTGLNSCPGLYWCLGRNGIRRHLQWCGHVWWQHRCPTLRP